MKSLRKTMRKSVAATFGVLLMLGSLGCNEELPVTPNKFESSKFSGVQNVLVTNNSGTLMDVARDVTATINYPTDGKIEIILSEEFNGSQKACRLEGYISKDNRINVRFVDNSTTYSDESDGELTVCFAEYFGLSEFNLNDDCPEWSGLLTEDKLDLSCNFCCDIPQAQGSAMGEVTCSLVQR